MSSLVAELSRPALERGWTVEQRVRLIAGALVTIGTLLALKDARWLLLTGFVGVNLIQSGFTGWCLMSNLLSLGGVGRKTA